MLGFSGDSLTHFVSPTTGRLVIDFPSMSELARGCGDGCQWGYVLKLEGLANGDAEPDFSDGDGGEEGVKET